MIKNKNFPSCNSYFAEEGKLNFELAKNAWDIKFTDLDNVTYNTKKYKSLYEAVSRFNVKILNNYNIDLDYIAIFTSEYIEFNKYGPIIIVFYVSETLDVGSKVRLLVNSDGTYLAEWQE